MYYLHCLGITKAIIDPMNILIYTDRHTPYGALKCVIDNLQLERLDRFILAY